MATNSADSLQYKALYLKLNSLNIYHELQNDSILHKARDLFATLADDSALESCIFASSAFLNALIKDGLGMAWQDYIIYRIITHVNPFSLYFSEVHEENKYGLWLTEAAALDLSALQEIASFSLDNVVQLLRMRAIAENNALVLQRLQDTPTWPIDLGVERIHELLSNSGSGIRIFSLLKDSIEERSAWQRLAKALSHFHASNGCGAFCFNHVFRWQDGTRKELLPVALDRQMQDHSLYDYTQTLVKLEENTECFLRGESAENALLYGPRGTGKSSSVRLMVQRYAKSGLRLIELSREQLSALPAIFSYVHALNIRFVIFIDDLSFDEMNDEYTLLKNILDGSVVKQAENVLIYVTSNRRHLVSERFADTENALYANDVRSERLSLAERFGLRLRFVTPNKADYLKLIHHVLAEKDIRLNDEGIKKIEKAALSDSANEASMTPRNALRFIRDYLAKGDLNVR